MPSTAAAPYAGVFPIAPTPFSDSGDLDLEGMRRVLDCMVDQGVDGICILANYSEQFLLSDEERDVLLDLCLTHVAGRVPVIVTCSHFSTRVAEAAPLPIMVQDAPLSGVTLSVPLLARLARAVPQLRYFKIEVAQAADKLRALIEAGGNTIAGPFDGEESITLMADLDAGATGTMPSALLPDLIRPVLVHHRAGRRAEAAAAYARILPLINFENRQCGLRATKAVMAEGGVIKSEAVRHPLQSLHPATRAGLLELARALDPVALRWGK